MARQQFFQTVQHFQKLKAYLSPQRCIALMEAENAHKARLWQIISLEQSLADLLANAFTQAHEQKVAAVLFIVADKFFSLYHRLNDSPFALPLSLNNLGLYENQAIFIGFLPTQLSELPLAPLETVLDAVFQATLTTLTTHPQLNPAHIWRFLHTCAKDHSEHPHEFQLLEQFFIPTA